MSFKAAKCPNCAGDLQVPEDRDTVKCMYCGSDIVVREAIKLAGGVNIENLLLLAKTAEESMLYDEAYKYYSAVLEHEADNLQAWIGKAFISTIKENDLLAANCFNKALTLLQNKHESNYLIIDRIIALIKEADILQCNVEFYVGLLNKLNIETKEADRFFSILTNLFTSKVKPVIYQYKITGDDETLVKNVEWLQNITRKIKGVSESDFLELKKTIVETLVEATRDSVFVPETIENLYYGLCSDINTFDKHYAPPTNSFLKRQKSPALPLPKNATKSFWKKLFE